MHKDVGSGRFVRIFTGSGCGQKTFKFFTMLDFFINTGVDLFWYGLGFYGGYKLGLINGGIKQLDLIDKEFDEMVANA